MKKLTPNLAVKNVRETVNYYVENLGFKLLMAVNDDRSAMGDELVDGKEYVWANVLCGDVAFMFQREDSFVEDIGKIYTEVGSSATYYIEIENIDSFYETLKDKVEIVYAIDTIWYGAREFYIRDCNGYVLGFFEMQGRE
jgi:uncharacterized glyoxalase superfamily protein PhnB